MPDRRGPAFEPKYFLGAVSAPDSDTSLTRRRLVGTAAGAGGGRVLGGVPRAPAPGFIGGDNARAHRKLSPAKHCKAVLDNYVAAKARGPHPLGGHRDLAYWNGYMDGAVRSGERAATEVLDRL